MSGAFAFILVAAGAAAVYFFATPRYDATSLISIGLDTPVKADMPRDKAVEEALLSIAVIAETDDVVRVAANRVGFERLLPKLADLLKKPESTETSAPGGETRVLRETDRLLPDLRRSLSVKPQAKTNLIAISFGNANPVVAAEFANAVAEATINRQIELSIHPGAVNFYEGQRARFEADIKNASAALARFVSEKSVYSIKLQQELLMRRASDLAAALGSAKALIAERASQKQALVQQLTKIKPVADTGLESDFLKRFGGAADSGGAVADAPQTLPLSLERVYRDGFASLVNLNSELSGLQSRESNLTAELNEINASLSDLSANAAEFGRLERAVDAATNNATIFERRTVDETIDRDLANARMSSLRVVQSAAAPFKPAFPSRRLIGSAALIGGLLAAIAAALGAEMFASKGGKSAARVRRDASEAVVEQGKIA